MDAAPATFRPAGALPAAPLSPYAGRFDARLAAHLLRRAGFGGSPQDVARIAQVGMRDAVDTLIRFPATPNLPVAIRKRSSCSSSDVCSNAVRSERRNSGGSIG
jgi:hypothetical protein